MLAMWVRGERLDAMRRVVAILFAVFTYLMFSGDALAAPLTKADVVGTYRIDGATLHGQTLPTNFFAFAMTLNADGSFVTTNVPVDFFLGYTPAPTTPEPRGDWKLRHESEGASFVYTGENDYLDLHLTNGPKSGFGLNIEPTWTTPRIKWYYHSLGPDHAEFYLKKQQ
jgi:hypothetical protein